MLQHLKTPARRVAFGCIFSLVSSIASADGMSELAACHDSFNRSEFRAVVTHCTQALLSVDLPREAIPLALKTRGFAYYSLGQFDLAIGDYDKLIRLDPKNGWSYSGRGLAHFGKGQNDRLEVEYDRAIADYGEAIRLEPRDARHYLGRGNVYLDKGEADSAIQDFDRAITLQPGDAVFYYVRGLAYEIKEDFEQATQDYSKAIALKPDLAEAYLHRGHAYHALGDEARAKQDRDRAIELDPSLSDPG